MEVFLVPTQLDLIVENKQVRSNPWLGDILSEIAIFLQGERGHRFDHSVTSVRGRFAFCEQNTFHLIAIKTLRVAPNTHSHFHATYRKQISGQGIPSPIVTTLRFVRPEQGAF